MRQEPGPRDDGSSPSVVSLRGDAPAGARQGLSHQGLDAGDQTGFTRLRAAYTRNYLRYTETHARQDKGRGRGEGGGE